MSYMHAKKKEMGMENVYIITYINTKYQMPNRVWRWEESHGETHYLESQESLILLHGKNNFHQLR